MAPEEEDDVLTPEEKQEYHNRGQQAYGDEIIPGSGRTPWRGGFESEEHYDERCEQHQKGYDNAASQDS